MMQFPADISQDEWRSRMTPHEGQLVEVRGYLILGRSQAETEAFVVAPAELVEQPLIDRAHHRKLTKARLLSVEFKRPFAPPGFRSPIRVVGRLRVGEVRDGLMLLAWGKLDDPIVVESGR